MNRSLLITGASTGIGRAICKTRLAAGDRVVGIARDFDKREDCDQLDFDTVEMDLSDLSQVPYRLTDLSRNRRDIDAVVANAGEGVFGHLEQFSFEQIRHALDLNFTSQVFLVRAFLPNFKQRGYGDIILIGSEAGLRGGQQGSLYCAAKFALRGFAQSLREEIAASGVRVTVINPGMVKTRFHDNLTFQPGSEESQHILPSDVAAAVSLALDSRTGTVFDEIDLTPQKKVINFGRQD